MCAVLYRTARCAQKIDESTFSIEKTIIENTTHRPQNHATPRTRVALTLVKYSPFAFIGVHLR